MSKQGKHYLTSLQFCGVGSADGITSEDGHFSMMVATLVLRMRSGERRLFADILALAVKKVLIGQSNHDPTIRKIPVPTSQNEIRSFIDGSGAILNNVPIPPVHTTESGDAYVLPSDFIRLYFSLGVLQPYMVRSLDEVDSGDGVSEVWQSKKAKEALRTLEPKDDSSYKIFCVSGATASTPILRTKTVRVSTYNNFFYVRTKKSQ